MEKIINELPIPKSAEKVEFWVDDEVIISGLNCPTCASVVEQGDKECGCGQVLKWDEPELPVTDTLTRHKWPEEKPEETKGYLVNVPNRKDGNTVMWYWVEKGLWGFKDGSTLITPSYEPTHWWELPEVKE